MSASLTAASALRDYRIIRRSGDVVAFDPTKIAVSMWRAFLAVSGHTGKRGPSKKKPSAVNVAATDAGCGSEASSADGNGGGDGGPGGDGGDGDGDGDSEGPRRPLTRTRTRSSHHNTSATKRCPKAPLQQRRQHKQLIQVNADAAHRRGIIALVILTFALLAAAIVLAIFGFPILSGEAMGMACGLPSLAKRLVKPK